MSARIALRARRLRPHRLAHPARRWRRDADHGRAGADRPALRGMRDRPRPLRRRQDCGPRGPWRKRLAACVILGFQLCPTTGLDALLHADHGLELSRDTHATWGVYGLALDNPLLLRGRAPAALALRCPGRCGATDVPPRAAAAECHANAVAGARAEGRASEQDTHPWAARAGRTMAVMLSCLTAEDWLASAETPCCVILIKLMPPGLFSGHFVVVIFVYVVDPASWCLLFKLFCIDVARSLPTLKDVSDSSHVRVGIASTLHMSCNRCSVLCPGLFENHGKSTHTCCPCRVTVIIACTKECQIWFNMTTDDVCTSQAALVICCNVTDCLNLDLGLRMEFTAVLNRGDISNEWTCGTRARAGC